MNHSQLERVQFGADNKSLMWWLVISFVQTSHHHQLLLAKCLQNFFETCAKLMLLCRFLQILLLVYLKQGRLRLCFSYPNFLLPPQFWWSGSLRTHCWVFAGGNWLLSWDSVCSLCDKFQIEVNNLQFRLLWKLQFDWILYYSETETTRTWSKIKFSQNYHKLRNSVQFAIFLNHMRVQWCLTGIIFNLLYILI